MTGLEERLRRTVRRTGPIPFAEYMALALADRRGGYYGGARSPDPLGRAGDFTTAPEVSQMFGELVGAWCADMWERMGAPNPARLVELGPGRGTLMADLLRAARAAPAFRRALDIHLVEISPALRRAQEAALGAARPTWHDGLATVPGGPMLLVANEFFDALPVHRFAATEAGWRERMVGLSGDGERLEVRCAPGPTPASRLLAALGRAPEPGAAAEVSPAALALAGDIARRIAADGGAALIVDYGGGGGDTAAAMRRHRAHPLLADPGAADLSARVDFPALARAAREAGARVRGPVGQGAFLRALGIRERAARLGRAAPEAAAEVDAALRRLTAPGEMGVLFQAMAFGAPGGPAPAGFPA